MSAKRAWLLAGFLGLTFSTIFALPKLRITDSALDYRVPARIGLWQTHGFEPSKEEKAILAADTKFGKAHCFLKRYEDASPITGEMDPNRPQYDMADLSVVLSGDDLTNSIHRPERCMEAQGHRIHDSKDLDIQVDADHQTKAKRLISTQPLKLEDGRIVQNEFLTYYFFVGHDHLTTDHMERNKVDMLDRLKKGEAQHWAYVLVTIRYAPSGTDDLNGQLLPMEAADRKATGLLRDFCASNLNWEMLAATAPVAP